MYFKFDSKALTTDMSKHFIERGSCCKAFLYSTV